jgi:hypothetical protein
MGSGITLCARVPFARTEPKTSNNTRYEKSTSTHSSPVVAVPQGESCRLRRVCAPSSAKLDFHSVLHLDDACRRHTPFFQQSITMSLHVKHQSSTAWTSTDDTKKSSSCNLTKRYPNSKVYGFSTDYNNF